MQGGRVERGNPRNTGFREEQGQLRPAKNDSVDPFLVPETFDQRNEPASCVVSEVPLEKLADVMLMNPRGWRVPDARPGATNSPVTLRLSR